MTEDPGFLRGVEVDVRGLIERPRDARLQAESSRPSEAAWASAVRAHNARIKEDRRIAWYEYHVRMADRHRELSAAVIREHEEAAARLKPVLPREYKIKEV